MLASLDDPKVARALDAWAEALAAAANTIHLLDPGQIILGGPDRAAIPARRGKVQAKLPKSCWRASNRCRSRSPDTVRTAPPLAQQQRSATRFQILPNLD